MCKENEIIQKDIKSISEWLNTSLDNLQIDYQIESMENYKKYKSRFMINPLNRKRSLSQTF